MAKQITREKKIIQRLKQKKPKDLDERFRNAHETVFERTDCLECANCCKTTSPIFLPSDIERISKHLKLKTKDFQSKYLKIDEDGDAVLKKSPCSFLLEDNTCAIYAHRPKACREYPHTNRKRIHQILDLTLKNASVCPAVQEILLHFED